MKPVNAQEMRNRVADVVASGGSFRGASCGLCRVQIRMKDPVLAADGFTYERIAIQEWLKRSQDSPVTGRPLEHTFLTPNNGLRHLLLLS